MIYDLSIGLFLTVNRGLSPFDKFEVYLSQTLDILMSQVCLFNNRRGVKMGIYCFVISRFQKIICMMYDYCLLRRQITRLPALLTGTTFCS